MKTILYSIIAVLIFSTVTVGYTNKANRDHSVVIQSVERNISSVLLSQSAEIISGRLRDFGSEKHTITVIPEKSQIQVIVTDTRDLQAVENLLVQKGAFALYETYNHQSLIELLQGDDHLFSLFMDGDDRNSDAEVGCTSVTGVEKINDYLNSLGQDQKCKFAWSQGFDGSRVCLYALRTEIENGALLSGTDVESMRYVQDEGLKTYSIEVKFKEEAIELWSDATRRNMNKTIAFVLDNKVIFSPRVNEAIDGGNCQISGDFTEDQVRYIAALGNNGELPVNFEVVK
jgi:preprotein translocase subunit SecD